ncbi:MAG: DUF5032 domain-containing protein [Tannerellaceae bacterium]|nr:DUF5032 domain-containing protein [Tannerellaceae bacterium]
MKKYILLFTVLSVLTMSCNKNDDPEITIPNKITKITCTKNGATYFSADISYNAIDGSISRVVTTDATIRYEYIGSTILESITRNFESAAINVTHTTTQGVITETSEDVENPYYPSETYTENQYTYHYERSLLKSIDWTYTWPKQDANDKYGEDTTESIDQFTWENGNLSQYKRLAQSIMEYEYKTEVQPENFPFRLLNTFTPVEFENFTPFNVYFGINNRNLVGRAYWYHITTANQIAAEYTFSYTGMGEYITGMTIVESIYETNTNNSTETNTYVYTFEYNYNPN